MVSLGCQNRTLQQELDALKQKEMEPPEEILQNMTHDVEAETIVKALLHSRE
jgi:hypothetical protein